MAAHGDGIAVVGECAPDDGTVVDLSDCMAPDRRTSRGALTRLQLFVCTFAASLDNFNATPKVIIEQVEPENDIVALNCNFGHKVAPGYAKYVKVPKAALAPAVEAHRAPVRIVVADAVPAHAPRAPRRQVIAPFEGPVRTVEGDGSCFNSSVEMVIVSDKVVAAPAPVREMWGVYRTEKKKTKIYKAKVFTTGSMQVPGVLKRDYGDGIFVARHIADYLTRHGLATDKEQPITVKSYAPIMLNYKCQVVHPDPNAIIDLDRLALILNKTVEEQKGGDAAHADRASGSDSEAAPRPRRQFFESDEEVEEDGDDIKGPLPPPPFRIIAVKKPAEDQKTSWKFVIPPGSIRVNVFFRKKINILGASTPDNALLVYGYLQTLLARFPELICVPPEPDSDSDSESVDSEDARLQCVVHGAMCPAHCPRFPPVAPTPPEARPRSPFTPSELEELELD